MRLWLGIGAIVGVLVYAFAGALMAARQRRTFGTLVIAILAFAVVVHGGKLLPRPDVVVLYAAALASITWNTETASAALLVFVGLAGAWISYRALVAHRWRRDVGANG